MQQKLVRTVQKPSSSVKIVIDDESYFRFGHSHISGNDIYYSQNKEKTPADVKYYEKKRFEPKLLMWLAINEQGHSEPFFVPSRGNIDEKVYCQECILNNLKPFLKQYHSEKNYVIWPDLASTHYAKDTVAPKRR